MSATRTKAQPGHTLEDGLFVFARVVACTDGTAQSLLAVEQAVKLASAAEIVVASVVDADAELVQGPVAARVQCEHALAAARQRFHFVEPRLLGGRVTPAVVELARSEATDLVAVGATHRSRASRVMHGSAMIGLARHAPCSVLVARESENFPEPVLLASDGSAASDLAADATAAIAARQRRAAILINVGDGMDDNAIRVSAQAVRIREASGIEAAMVMADGDPATRILETAARLQAGLVVVGSRGVGGLKLLGSVSERVVRGAATSVLVVRDTEEATN
jgi:nucleotide-binding universal stress UspA family protein